MKNLTLVERIDDGNKIIIKYSFGDIIIEYRYNQDTTPSLFFEAKNTRGAWIINSHISEYDKLRLMSGIEELAKSALQYYYDDMSAYIEKFNI